MLDALANLPAPTPDAIKAAREAARHSQAAAAVCIGLADARAWWRYESGAYAMPAAAWALYLLSTGQHPELLLSPQG